MQARLWMEPRGTDVRLLVPRMRQQAITLLASAIIVLCATATAEASLITLKEASWEFYQGGYVQADNENWQTFQDHYGGSQRTNTVSHTLGGAYFESNASMNVTETDDDNFYNVSAFAEFTLAALVDEKSPEGSAQAFGGLSAFNATIEITGGRHYFEYAGPELTWMGNDEPIESGSVLEPGVYHFSHNDPFPGAGFFWQTDMLGPGERERFVGQVDMNFTFQQTTPTPGPGTVAIGLAGLLVMAHRPRRRRV